MGQPNPGSILIYTDGACSGNPGPGGWGSIVLTGDQQVMELGGSHPSTTNNRMEMAAAIHALGALEITEPCQIVLYTDSVYVIRGITQWIWGWRSRGWKSADGKDVANRELWEELSRQVGRVKPATIEWKYVRGHNGNPGNERCDEIAVSYSKSKPAPLYKGDQNGYFVDLNEAPVEESLPAPKPVGGSSGQRGAGAGSSGGSGSGGSSGPVTYLSYQNGVLSRHKTWADCEKQVKGKSGAKFKKAKSAQEEREILKSWGLDPSTAIN